MTSNYQKLREQIAQLETQAEEARQRELQEAISKIKEMIRLYDLKPQDIFESSRRGARKGTKVAAKYRDPATGATWSGRGREPRWMQGKKREDFAI